MKWVVAIVLCFVFPWVGVPMLIWLLFPTLVTLFCLDRILGSGDRKTPSMDSRSTSQPLGTSIFHIISSYLESLVEVDSPSEAIACELMERFKSTLSEGVGPDGMVSRSLAIRNLEEVLASLPPGSIGRARVLSFTLTTIDRIPEVSLRSEAREAILKKEAWITIETAIRWYSTYHVVQPTETDTIAGLEALSDRIGRITSEQDELIRTLCGLAKID